MKYDTLRKLLVRNYSQETINRTTLYKNSDGKVVATEKNNNLIVMYANCDCNIIWSNKQIAVIAVAKDFRIICNNEVSLADVVTITGLCGKNNTVERVSNMLLEVVHSDEFDSLEIGTMGNVISPTMVSLEIGVDIDMSALQTTSAPEVNFRNIYQIYYGVMNYKRKPRNAKVKRIQPKDYQLYEYLKNKHSWYWEDGYWTAGSAKTRLSISKLQFMNYHKIAKINVTVK